MIFVIMQKTDRLQFEKWLAYNHLMMIFVFQGKRTTGGGRRKFETPQYTQVGNAVPPLMARAIAEEILKNIK